MSTDKQNLLHRLGAEIRAAQRAVDAVDEAISERLGLSRTELRAIDHLYPDAELTSGQLARATLLTAGAMTILLDRLEAAGYIERRRDPDDRRRVYVTLTDDGRRVVGDLYAGVARLAAPIAARYSPEQLATIVDFLRNERIVNEAYAASLRGLDDLGRRARGTSIALASRLVGEAAGWASRVVGEVAGQVAGQISRAAGEMADEAARGMAEPASRAGRRINEAAEAAADRVRQPAERAARRLNAALDPGHPDHRRDRPGPPPRPDDPGDGAG